MTLDNQVSSRKLTKSGESFRIHHTLLTASPYQIRQDYRHVPDLAESIKAVGQRVPCSVWVEKHPNGNVIDEKQQTYFVYLEDGHSRCKAFELIQSQDPDHPILAKGILVTLASKAANEIDRLANQIIYNNSGKPYNAIEMLDLFKRLRGFGLSDTEIHKRCGVSLAQVGNIFKLAVLPPKALNLIADGTITYSSIVQRLRDTGEDVALVMEEIETWLETDKDIRGKFTASKAQDLRAKKSNKPSYHGLSDKKLITEIIHSMAWIEEYDEYNDKVLIPRELIQELKNRIKKKRK